METIEIDLPNDVLLTLALLAHERDITLNQLFIEILTNYIIEHTGVDLVSTDEVNKDDENCT